MRNTLHSLFKDLNIKIEVVHEDAPEKNYEMNLADLFAPYHVDIRDETGKVIKTVPMSREEYKKYKQEEKKRQQREAWENLSPLGKFFYYFVAVILGVLFLFGFLGLFIH